MINEDDLKKIQKIKWYHQIQLGSKLITDGECSHGNPGEDYFTNRFGFLTNFEGRTVLDIGCWDGLFSFEAEKRGADVLAIDIPQEEGGNWGKGEGFKLARKILKSNVEYKNCNVYSLDKLDKTFDITLFYGILNHLSNPIEALKQISKVTKDFCLIECEFLADDPKVSKPLLEFRNKFQSDYYFVPNLKGIIDMLHAAGFMGREIIFMNPSWKRLTIKAIK